MKKMSKEELRKAQMGILDYLVDICSKNNISYFLTYGTLLGAIRHKGYIPWDDDIDVAMLRADFDRLVDVCNAEENPRYRLSCVENNPSCMYPFGKMIDERTVLYERGEKGISIGVYIDIFVYDNAPLDLKQREKGFDKLDLYGHWRQYQLPLKPAPLSLRRVAVLTIKFLIDLFLPRQFFTRRIVSSAQKYRATESDYVCDFTEPFYNKRWVVEKSLFTDLILVEFEGKKYNAPRYYDKWLRLQYGDYMKLPSKEEQDGFHHDIEAFYK